VLVLLPALCSLLLNDLVRPCEHVGRNRKTDLLCGFEIDHKLKLHWLLDRNICGFGAKEIPRPVFFGIKVKPV
jgi:hypothetical protein